MCSLAVLHDLITPCYFVAVTFARKGCSKMGCILLLHTNENILEHMSWRSKQSSKMDCILLLHTNEKILEHMSWRSKQSNILVGVQKGP